MPMFKVELELIGTRILFIEAKSLAHAKVIIADGHYPLHEDQDEIKVDHVVEIKEL